MLPPPLAQPGAHGTVLALPSMFVDQGIEDLFAQPRALVGFFGHPSRRPRGRRPFERAHHPDGVAEDGQLQAQVSEPRIVALQGEQAELTDGQTEIFQLLNVESGTCRDRTGDEPGQDDKVTPRRKPQLNPVTGGEHIHRVTHDAPTDCNESAMVNTFVSPVISNIFMILESATTTCNSPPSSRHRFRAPTRTPSAVESRKVT